MSKGVIWSSEYSLGPQIWGPGGARAPGAPLDPLLGLLTILGLDVSLQNQQVSCLVILR